ncbi:MAG: hypothetical protein NPIRA02_13910 [Nitrospirales bacterium]|nr:MAG: hypothetical protein NPIRA02_13910 [Nitrospirales bacterium]
MISETTRDHTNTLSSETREYLRQVIQEASEPIAPFWPMKTMVAQNPIHGLEYLPFDEAVQKGRQLLGGHGYLPNHEYRQLYHQGRITSASLTQAFARAGPRYDQQASLDIGSRQITAKDVWQFHIVFGCEALDPVLQQWEFSNGEATKRFRHDLPEASQKRIIEQTIKECEHCREYPEEAYLTNLWKCTLASLALDHPRSDNHQAVGAKTHASDSPPPSIEITLPAQRTMSDWVDSLAGSRLVEQINNQLIKWISTFVDEGLAAWEMPQRREGFYRAWQELAQHDHSAKFLGIHGFNKKISDLPSDPEDALADNLHRLGIPQERWRDYLSRQLSQLPGWARYVRWLGEHPTYHAQRQHPIDTTQYLAVRLFYEVELTHVTCQQAWDIDGTLSALCAYWQSHMDDYQNKMSNGGQAVPPLQQAICHDAWRLFHLAQFFELSPIDVQDLPLSDAQHLLDWLDVFPSDRHGPVWLEAYEENFRRDFLQKLASHQGGDSTEHIRPQAQLVFCIDVRSESFRRHIEAQGPYETFGFAGFFGIPISHQAFDSEERAILCPVLLSPNHAVSEQPRSGEHEALQKYSSGTRWQQLGHRLFHDLKHNPVGSLMLIDLLGVFFSVGLVGKTLVQKPFHAFISAMQRWVRTPVPTQISVSPPADSQHPEQQDSKAKALPPELAHGFTLTEQATFIENGLRAMGLTKNFGRFVVLCGHGSETDNNPYYGALDCGACGGNPGDVNARVFATMANNPAVRKILHENGLAIPDDTWFLPGKHNTTTDRVIFYDIEELPMSHVTDLRELQKGLEYAGMNQALERCQRIPQTPTSLSPEQAFTHVERRSFDWANPRPEWGLAGNAVFLIGRRTLTKGHDLGGRVFLHSYDPLSDNEGAILEKIMTAPLIVGEWINTGYYFSGVDPWHYGSGSKVLHNVVSGVGVMLGSQSDLQMGFPLQTVNDGETHYHEPMRLLAIIEASPHIISSIIHKHDILQQLFHNQWMNLVALDPKTCERHRYNPDATWEVIHGEPSL